MEYIKLSTIKSYGVTYTVTHQKLIALEIYQYNGLTIKLPVGELMMGIIELIDYLPDKAGEDLIYVNREYNLKEFLSDFLVTEKEVQQLLSVKEYLNRIADKKMDFSYQTLSELFLRILPRAHSLFNLFDFTNRYRIRQVRSKIQLPFGYSTNQIISELKKSYSSFSFFTLTEIHTLSELCALSLFEILESGQSVFRCCNCERLFFAEKNMKYCSRPAPINEHQGCVKLMTASYNRQYRKKPSVREYKKVYNRLLSRVQRSTTTLNDIQTMKEFKSGWAMLKIQYRHSDDFEKRKMEYLQSERWS